ncbi:EAL domain-containing protein [Nitratiruptor tergarcus]|uniref:Diguanylate cyclase (GGDEF) domain-containing protein n=1 Tax=Nitratiruptor tergarcus DSM 16512 TaxID=1069081 RepID=A0A1W1WR52_9BACT|nr:EAL domain-containing protein [Nitratiruptor tergarcus]SMC08490.1 diguanylate cyclase (GGDEF) domain-containing protein [Nitratiruptor tergarcus DSM 16512]
MTKNSKIKISIFLLFSIVAISFLIFFQNYTYNFFDKKNRAFFYYNELRDKELQLNYNILKASFFLYEDYDEIAKLQKEMDNILKKFQTMLQKEDEDIADLLQTYKLQIEHKNDLIERFKTLNAAIKNSTMYLATLLQKIPAKISSHNRNTIISIIADIFLIKNSLDEDFLHGIAEKLEKLQAQQVAKTKFFTVFHAHIKIFLQNFSKYKHILLEILDNTPQKTLEKIKNHLEEKYFNEAQKLNSIFFAIIAFYIIALIFILLLLYKLEKDNRALKQLQKSLEDQTLHDDLTKLYNRKAFKKDVRKIKQPFFALVNINSFKHYNDFYGNATGDHILREVAKILKKITPHHYNAKFYRIGGDDFGILIDEKIPIDDANLAKTIIEYFDKHKITFKSVEIYLAVSIGITRKRPLIETADMALKYVKQHSSLHYCIYDDSLGFFQRIKENLKKSKILKEAIDKDLIIPFFQPIIDNKTGKIVKYEALARLKNDKGFYESIFPYLEIAKEAKLYEYITHSIIEKSFAEAAKQHKSISVNISMKDIENPDMLKFFGKMFAKYPDIAKYITFEILESETLKDYEAVKNFFSIIRSQGSQVAIDDFGSGYSNFSHIFNLEIDYIKIDGSLIQNLDKDESARQIVAAIVFLAKKAKIATIAEFVHSKEIFEAVKKLGIDYSQGYYIAEPSSTF